MSLNQAEDKSDVGVEGVKFVCKNSPFSESKPGTREFYKDPAKDNDEVEIGRLFDHMAMGDTEHVLLTFKNSKVYISDTGSLSSTWLEHKGILKPNTLYELQDGIQVGFGVKEDEGSAMDPGAARFSVAFLPARPSKRQSTANYDLHEDPTMNEGEKSPTTKLARTIKIPWADTFRLGHGIDALTGEFTAACAFQQYKEGPRPELLTGNLRMQVEAIRWQDVTTSQHEYKLEGGATINAACPITLDLQGAANLSKDSSSSTILIELKQSCDSGAQVQYVEPSGHGGSLSLSQDAESLSGADFRDKFGDYYIAGCQYGYSFRMVVACKTKSSTVTDSDVEEAKMLVMNFFSLEAKHKKARSKSRNCAMLHAFIEAFGCSADASGITNRVLSVDEALSILPKVLKDPKGSPRIAVLYHYSTLPSTKLPLGLEIDVPGTTFDTIRGMRDMYFALDVALLHPALKRYQEDCRQIHSAREEFHEKRTRLVHIREAHGRADRLEDSPVYRDLLSAKLRADELIRQYDFIRYVKNMSKSFARSVPSEVDRHYRWECGMVDGALKEQRQYFKQVTFDMPGLGGCEAFEVDWVSPVTKTKSKIRRIFNLDSGESNMSFHRIKRVTPQTRRSGQKPYVPPSLHPLSPITPMEDALEREPSVHSSLSSELGEPKKVSDHGGSFTYELAGRDIYIIGWTLSCNWDEKKKPVVEVDDPDNFIFKNHLKIRLDTSYTSEWHCRVTFVFQSDHDFPDLDLTNKGSRRHHSSQ